jgi:hypothetical protein
VAIETTHGLFAPQLRALPSAAAEWKLAEQTAIEPSRALKAWRGTYNGAPAITLTLFPMPWSPESAWDAIQEWRTVPGAEQGTLKRFVQGVTAGLPPGTETLP